MREKSFTDINDSLECFHKDKSGHLMIENLRVADLAKQINKTPFYVMSKTQLHKNF